MRRRRSRMGSDEANVDMTPMLDIVFIMLIFFIVTATFLDERGIDLTQPPQSDDPPPSNNDRQSIVVYVDELNNCSVDNRQTDCDRVPLGVERLLAEKPNASIIMRIHEKARNELLVDLKDSFDRNNMQSKIEVIRG